MSSWFFHAALSLVTLLSPALLWAEQATILLETPFKVDGAFGLRQSTNGTVTPLYNTKVTTLSRTFVLLSLESEFEPGDLVAGVVRSKEGLLHFGEFQPRWMSQETLSLPICEEQLPTATVLSGQRGMLESLVQVRTAREKVAREKFLLALNDFSPERLQKLEFAFGLDSGSSTPIQEVRDPFTLVDRLNRLHQAINTYDVFHKKRRGKPTPQPTPAGE